MLQLSFQIAETVANWVRFQKRWYSGM